MKEKKGQIKCACLQIWITAYLWLAEKLQYPVVLVADEFCNWWVVNLGESQTDDFLSTFPRVMQLKKNVFLYTFYHFLIQLFHSSFVCLIFISYLLSFFFLTSHNLRWHGCQIKQLNILNASFLFCNNRRKKMLITIPGS